MRRLHLYCRNRGRGCSTLNLQKHGHYMGKIKKKFLSLLLLFIVTFGINTTMIVERSKEDYESDDEKQLFI